MSRRSRSRSDSTLERWTIGHLTVLLLIATWGFGGQIGWARSLIIGWSSLAPMITFAAWWQGRTSPRPPPARAFAWVAVILLFDAMVGMGCLHPGFRHAVIRKTEVLVQVPLSPWWPTVVEAGPALRWLWLLNGIFLSTFNIFYVVRHRGVIRRLLLILAINALVLSVFGTFQKLLNAPGLYFGLVKSPNEFFFASFIYHNHWGATMVLCAGASLGLLFHYIRHPGEKGFWHSPGFIALVAVFLMAATIPLSGSRSCTLLIAVLTTGALLHYVTSSLRRHRGTSTAWLRPGLIIVLFLAGACTIFWIGERSIAFKLARTREQLDRFRATGSAGARVQLYRDTWTMAKARPLFGWGLRSYRTVFVHFNTQRFSPVDGLEINYAEAHSDWLQSLAEVGFAGTTLIVLLIVLPLRMYPAWRKGPALSRYLLGGCALILLYAWLEFPFACPAVLLGFGLCFFSGIKYAVLDAASHTSEP